MSKAYIEGTQKDAHYSINIASKLFSDSLLDTKSLQGTGTLEADSNAEASRATIIAEDQECPNTDPSNLVLFLKNGSADPQYVHLPWTTSDDLYDSENRPIFYNTLTGEQTIIHPMLHDQHMRDSAFLSDHGRPDLFHEDGSPDVALIPPPWIASVSTTQWPGEYFYFNPDTLESTFTHPLENDHTSMRDSSGPYRKGSPAEVFPEHSVSSSYVPPVVPPAHAAPIHIPTPDVPADPCGSADAPGPFDFCTGSNAPPDGPMFMALPGGPPAAYKFPWNTEKHIS